MIHVQKNLGSLINTIHDRFTSLNAVLQENHGNVNKISDRLSATEASARVLQQMVTQVYLTNIEASLLEWRRGIRTLRPFAPDT